MDDKANIPAATYSGAATRPDPAAQPLPRVHNFKESWAKVTSSEGFNQFQRYTTLHLFNLRFLERELATVEDQILKAALKTAADNALSIEFVRGQMNFDVSDSDGRVSQELVEKLRCLIKQYDEALIAFNSIKGMETTLLDVPRPHFVGLDLGNYSGPWTEEMLFTRVVKPQSSNTEDSDIIRHLLRKLFIKITIKFHKFPKAAGMSAKNTYAVHTFFRKLLPIIFRKPPQTAAENIPAEQAEEDTQAPMVSQVPNSVRIGNSKAVSYPVDFLARLIFALVSGALLIAPLAILSFQSTRKAHLITVAVSTVVFSLLVSFGSKSTNSEIMAAAAGYTAVLVVFFAVAPQGYT